MRCPKCNGSMVSTYSRKEVGYTIRTRKCKACNHKEKTIEMLYSLYRDSIKKYNNIVKIISN